MPAYSVHRRSSRVPKPPLMDSDSDTEDFLSVISESRKAFVFTESTLEKFGVDHTEGTVVHDPAAYVRKLVDSFPLLFANAPGYIIMIIGVTLRQFIRCRNTAGVTTRVANNGLDMLNHRCQLSVNLGNWEQVCLEVAVDCRDFYVR